MCVCVHVWVFLTRLYLYSVVHGKKGWYINLTLMECNVVTSL